MNMKPRTLVYCTVRFVDFHYWPEAPTEVDYLRELHRHEFHVKVKMLVGHNDRDIEFHLLKKKVEAILSVRHKTASIPAHEGWWRHTMSCEMICDAIAQQLNDARVSSVEVSEDGENGAIRIYA